MHSILKAIITLLAPLCQSKVTEIVSVVLLDLILNITAGKKSPLLNLLFTGYAGLGKTNCVEVICNYLGQENLTIDGEEVLGWEAVERVDIPTGCTLAQLKAIIVQHCQPGAPPVIFFADEAQSMPEASRNFLKTITETGGKIKTFTVYLAKEEMEITINPFRQWFILATNESVKDSALSGASGRFTEVQFLPYDDKGKLTIWNAVFPRLALGDLELSDELRTMALRNCRPFARAIQTMVRVLRIRAIHETSHGRKIDSPESLKNALVMAGYFPGGWTKEDIAVIRYCAASSMGRQVQEIGCTALHGKDNKATKQVLDGLMQGGMIITLPNGRKGHTKEAVALLQLIDGAGKVKKAKAIAA